MIARPAPSTSDTAEQHDAPGGPAWHTVEPDALGLRLETSPHGLSQDEARRRLERDGPNQLAETPPTSPFVTLLHQFRSPLIHILLAATLVTLLLEEFIDAGVIADGAEGSRGPRRARMVDRESRPCRRRRRVAGLRGTRACGSPAILDHRMTGR